MASAPRVLSLLSASTEIVHRLGCAHLLVGRSHGCDDPPLATALPIATAPHVDPNASSLDLDKAVRAQAATGGPIYHIESELVRGLRPDVIITQEQCRICAVTPEDLTTVCEKLPSTTLVTIMPTTLDDVFNDISTIARALGVPARGERLVQYSRARLASLSALAPPGGEAPPRVAHLEWLAPLMGSGYWIAECVEAANCLMVHGVRGGHSATLEGLSLLSDADVIVIAPCGFSIERTHSELAKLLESDEWKALPAVRNGRVGVADGNLYFNRSSVGVLETAEIVAEIAHREMRGLFGHHGRRWVSLSELEAFCGREGATPPLKRVALAPPLEAEGARMAKAPKLAPGSGDGSVATPSEHVRIQVDRLRAADWSGAFALNSAANCKRLGDAKKFETVVGQNASFAALANPENACEFLEHQYKDGVYSIVVRMETADGPTGFVFDVCETKAGYATDGVRVEC